MSNNRRKIGLLADIVAEWKPGQMLWQVTDCRAIAKVPRRWFPRRETIERFYPGCTILYLVNGAKK